MRSPSSRLRHLRVFALWRRGAQRFCPLLFIWVLGCTSYPDASERLDETIVYTFHDETTDFAAHPTFSINDEVVVFSEGNNGQITRSTLDPTLAEAAVSSIVQNMESRGFRRVGADAAPTLGLSASVLNGTVVGYYYDYWSSYWGYYGWWYYQPYVYAYEYETGTLVVEATDLLRAGPPTPPPPPGPDAGVNPSQSLNVAWGFLVYGVLGTSSQNVQAALQGIDEAFAQSPYLQTGAVTP